VRLQHPSPQKPRFRGAALTSLYMQPQGALKDIAMKWGGKEFAIDELETSPDGQKTMWHECGRNHLGVRGSY
jgi:hypothetical protein